MAVHTVMLTDDQEVALSYQSFKDGVSPDQVVLSWITVGASQAGADLETRLAAFKGLNADQRTALRDKLLGLPDPVVVALQKQVADLQAQVATLTTASTPSKV